VPTNLLLLVAFNLYIYTGDSKDSMNVVSDTSAIMAVVLNEPAKELIRSQTRGANLIAPSSLHWEVGNALSAGFKRDRLSLDEALQAIREYRQNIPIRFVDVDLEAAIRLAHELGIYAYDAYGIACARDQNSPMLTLDGGQRDAAEEAGVEVIYITP
jgi:predicted nucleic acid-binding protein